MEASVPLFPCTSLGEILEFYRALGFAVTYKQSDPYLYAAVRYGGLDLHFSRLSAYGAKNAFGACLVFVPDVERVHQEFARALRTRFGRIPTAGLPRLTRLNQGRTRFKVFDPMGNVLIYIVQDEGDVDYWETEEGMSPLARALENAIFLRDTYANDGAAARVLDAALARDEAGDPVEHALALAARAELAVALGDSERAEAIRQELTHLPLLRDARERFRAELGAAEALERWIGGGDRAAGAR